jgi:DNA polymerase III delta subunit
MVTSNLTEIDGRDVKPAEIMNVVMVAPFLSPKRMVVVANVVDRFRPEPGRPPRRTFGPLEELFPKLEAGIPESTILVFTGGNRDRWGNVPFGTNPFVDRLKQIPGVSVEQFDELKAKDLLRFVKEEAALHGVRFKPGRSTRPFPPDQEWLRPKETDPAELLANLHPGDTLGLSNELQKLALYSMGADVTVDDVDLLCAGERTHTMFEFTDAVMDGDTLKAFSALEYLKNHGNEQGTLMFRLLASYKQAAIAGEMAAAGEAPEEIGKAIGTRHSFPRDKAIRWGRKLGRAGITAAFAAIVETDYQTKRGNIKDEAGMHVLLNRLCTIARQGR